LLELGLQLLELLVLGLFLLDATDVVVGIENFLLLDIKSVIFPFKS
jgi:hypothetical protein